MSANNGDKGLPARFKQALQEAEKTRDAKQMTGLFEKGAKLTNLGGDHGTDALEFWQKYLEQFREIRSEFTSEVVNENGAALEWNSRGTTADGKPVEYRGISVLEFEGERATAFRTYYDSAAFLREAK